MTLQEFISRFEQEVVHVEEGTVTMETVLKDLEEWDSLARVELLAVVDQGLGILLNPDQLKSCEVVGDIVALVKDQLEE